MRFISVFEVHPYSSIDTDTVWRKPRFILSDSLDFHKIDNQSIAFQAFARCRLTSLSVEEILLSRYVKLSANFRGQPLK